MISYDRTVYTFIDWLSDVGGLSRTLTIFVSGFLLVAEFNNLDWYLVSKLYTRQDLDYNIEFDSSDNSSLESIGRNPNEK